MQWLRADQAAGGPWPPVLIFSRVGKTRDNLRRVDLGYHNTAQEFMSLVRLWVDESGAVTGVADHRHKFVRTWATWRHKKTA